MGWFRKCRGAVAIAVVAALLVPSASGCGGKRSRGAVHQPTHGVARPAPVGENHTYSDDAVGSGGATAHFTWNSGTGVSTVSVTTLATMGRGRCAVGILDWFFVEENVDHPHHDAQAVRNCKPGFTARYTFTDDAHGLRGLGKAAVCEGAENHENASASQCSISLATSPTSAAGLITVPIDATSQKDKPCIWIRIIKRDGSVHESKGGDRTSCTK